MYYVTISLYITYYISYIIYYILYIVYSILYIIYSILYSIYYILYIIYYIISYYIISHYIILYYIILYHIISYYIILYYIILYCPTRIFLFVQPLPPKTDFSSLVAAHTKAGKIGTLLLNALKTSFSYFDKLGSFCLCRLCRLKPIFPAVAAHTKAGYIYIYIHIFICTCMVMGYFWG